MPGPRHAAAAPRVSYARSGDVNIAYQVVGSGPIDIVFVMGWVSHLEYFWNEPSFAAFLNRLASMARLILFDKRGTGLSDAVPISELPTLDQRMDDVQAVMDAAGSTARGADGRLGGRTAVHAVCGHASGHDRGPRHDRQLRAPPVGARLPVGTDRRGTRSILPDDHRAMGRAGGHRRARTLARARSGVSRLVVGVPAHGRQPRRGGRFDAHERGSGYPRRAAEDSRAHARHPPHGRSVFEDRRRTLPGRAHSGRAWWSYPATITCRLLAISWRCCRRSINSSRACPSQFDNTVASRTSIPSGSNTGTDHVAPVPSSFRALR